jgi:hypothetical protein
MVSSINIADIGYFTKYYGFLALDPTQDKHTSEWARMQPFGI